MGSLKAKQEFLTSDIKQKDISVYGHLRLVSTEIIGATCDRHLEVDAFRGLAVVLMLMFHGLYNFSAFSRHQSTKLLWVPQWYWDYMPEVIGGMFFLVVGISAALKFKKLSSTDKPYKAFLSKAVKLMLLASIISLATAVFIPRMTVYFGAIHCIAAITFIIYPFLRYSPTFNFKLGVLITVLGFIIRGYCKVPFSWLLWLGFRPQYGQTGGDWYPLIPWFGVALIGVGIGSIYFQNYSVSNRILKFRHVIENNGPVQILVWVGNHALIIYLLHQPIFITLCLLFGLIQFR